MTKDEAIKWLKVESSYIEENVGHGKVILEAYNMAINALEQQPCEDCISRQAAIDTIESWLSCDDYNKGERNIMRVTQSVLYDLPPVTPKPCEDCISRAGVLKHLENITMDTNPDHYECKDKWHQANGFNLCKVGIEMYVENLPSVTPRQIKGQWLEVIDDTDSSGRKKNWHYKCSICGNEDSGWGEFNYCPICGAEMEGM